MLSYTAAEIAAQVRGEVRGDGSVRLSGFAAAETARAGDLTFAESDAYFARAEQSDATAILAEPRFRSDTKVLICVPNARIAFARVLPLFFPRPAFAAGVHPTASVAATATVDPTAHIGPHCSVADNVIIGARTVLEAGDHIAANSRLGDDVHLSPNVTVYAQSVIGNRVRIHAGTVIGSDGFGYVFDQGIHLKVPQVGNVVIEDDVEIGANVAVDRGALGSTVIGQGTKIDNLVQIAHNVQTGKHCILVSQVGIAGSTKLGHYVILGGQVGLAGHLKIGDKVTVAAKSGVMHDIPVGEKWFGIPAVPDRKMKRQIIALQHLPELLRRVRDLEGARERKAGGTGEE